MSSNLLCTPMNKIGIAALLLTLFASTYAHAALKAITGGAANAAAATTSGSFTAGNCVKSITTGSSNIVFTDAGAACGTGGSAFSALTASTTINSILNTNLAQVWAWNTLTTETALSLTASALTSGKLLSVDATNVAGTGYAGYFRNTATSLSSYAGYFDGNVNITGHFNAPEYLNALGSVTTYTVLATDMGLTVTTSGASAIAVTLPQAGTAGFETGKAFAYINLGLGSSTFTPTTSLVNGFTKAGFGKNQGGYFISDGTNYSLAPFMGLGLPNINNNISIGSGALIALTTGTDSIAIGVNALSKETVVGFQVAVGSGALQNSLHAITTAGNTAVGYQALNALTTALGNTALGYQTGLLLTSSNGQNTLVGYQAGAALATGWNNSAVGFKALTTATIGRQNMAFGSASLQYVVDGIGNIGIGNGAGCAISSGGSNTFIGHLSGVGSNGCATVGVALTGSNNTSSGALALQFAQGAAAGNTAIGQSSGNLITTGADNTIIGNAVGSTVLTTGTGNILIGVNNAITTAAAGTTNTFRLGGTGGPLIDASLMNTATGQSTTLHGLLLLPDIPLDTASTDASLCRDTTSFSTKVGTGTLGICLGTSSLRYKKDVEIMAEGLKEINLLKPVNFHFKEKSHGDPKKKQYGFIAEDAVKVIPDLVSLDKDGNTNTFDYLGLVPVLVKSVQELKADNDNLRDALKEQQKDIEGLKSKIKNKK